MIIFSVLVIQAWMLSLTWRESKRKERIVFEQKYYKYNKLDKSHQGIINKAHIDSRIATKMAERAFNLASSANLGVVALQKALATPKLITREASKLNQLAKNSVDELFTTQGEYDWLKPLLSDQDLELLEEIESKKVKDAMKGTPQ